MQPILLHIFELLSIRVVGPIGAFVLVGILGLKGTPSRCCVEAVLKETPIAYSLSIFELEGDRFTHAAAPTLRESY